MEDVRQFVLAYIEGRVGSKQFLKELYDKPEIFEWLQSIVPKGKTRTLYKFDQCYSKIIEKTEVPYLIHDVIDEIWQSPGHSFSGRELNTFSLIANLVSEAFPDIVLHKSTAIEDKFNFLLDACPEYLDSEAIENSGIFEELMKQLPESMPKTKRIKEFRKRIKDMFYVEGQKYPRWIQGSEWPLSKTGKPTKFLHQKSVHNGEVCCYYFLDMDTKEEIEVMQAY